MEPSLSYARTSDRVSIAFTSTGSGPALVLMPGVPFSNLSAEWRIPVLRRAFLGLADKLTVVHYDGRGTGHSQRDVTDLSLDAMLGDLDAVVSALGLHRFALLGFYNSCTHAIAFAARNPNRVSRLVLFGGSLRGWDAMRGPGTQALLSLIERDWDSGVQRFLIRRFGIDRFLRVVVRVVMVAFGRAQSASAGVVERASCGLAQSAGAAGRRS